MRTRPTVIALTLLAATLAACGSDDPTVAESPADGSSAATATSEVEVEDFLFVPDSLEVAVGTTVTFTNNDRFGHTATSGAPSDPDGTFDVVLGSTTDSDTTGMTGAYTFDETGTFEYFCRYHPSMVGTIEVI